MSINFTTIIQDDMLLATAWGQDDNAQQVQNYGLELIKLAKKHHIKQLLADERQVNYALNTIDIYATAAFIAQNAPSMSSVAIVFNPNYQNDVEFWENVAVNRGLKVRFFTEMSKAQDWLTKQKTDSNN